MSAARHAVFWAVPLGAAILLAPLLAHLPVHLTLRLAGAALLLAALMLVANRRAGRRAAAALPLTIVAGAALSGAFLMLFVVAFHPPPSRANLLWMLGLPALVALGPPGWRLALILPFILLGWAAGLLLSRSLGIPLD